MKTQLTKRKNLLITVLAILVVFSTVLVGCGVKNSDTVADETFAENEIESTESTEATDETESTDETVETEPTVETEEVPEVTDTPETPEEPKEPAHTHKWSDATCTSPKTCECGETSGSKLNHDYSEGTCTRCGAKDPNYVPPHVHTWVGATCTTAKTCSGCGETSGSALGHNYNNGDCTRCGAHDPNYVPPHTHAWNTEEWTETVTTQDKVCVYCCGSCGAVYNSIDEVKAHQETTGKVENGVIIEIKHHGWYNDWKAIDIVTTITHHRRVCACGVVENID